MFTRTNRTRLTGALVAATALHVAAVAALLIPWTRNEPVVITIDSPMRYVPPSAPKLGGGGEVRAKATPIAKRTARPDATPAFTEPTPIETTIARNDGPPGPDGPGVLDGHPDAECVGEGCTGTEPTACEGANCGFVDLPRTITPIAIHQPQPAYPPVARLQGRTGVVVVEILVGIDGRVMDARVVQGSAPFDAPALAAVRGWRYQPVIVRGQAIAWKSTITLKFQLR